VEIKVGIQKSKIITDNPEILSALYQRFSFRIKGAEFFPAYRSRKWDGKKHFISRNGIFRSGLLERVCNILDDAGVSYTIDRDYEKDTFKRRKNIKGLSYYDYQWKAIQDAQRYLRAVVQSPTGSGKTIIMAGIYLNLQEPKSVFLFNKKQLAIQTYEFFKDNGIENIGVCTGEGYIHGHTMFCTVQSIDKIMHTHLDAEALFVDECHEFCKGPMTLAAIQSFPEAKYRLGFTATPPKQKNDAIALFNLEGSLGPVRIYKTTSELVDEGKLSKPIVQLVNIPRDEKIEDEDMSYTEVYKDCIVNNDFRNSKIKSIVELIQRNNSQARILIIVESLDHLKNLDDIDNVYTLEGVDDLTQRYKTIDKFLNHSESSCLIGTKIMQTGINIQEISHFINARGLKSEAATLQALGRALRKQDGQEKVFVFDFLDPYKYLKAHSENRKQSYKNEGHEVKVLNEK